MTKPLPESPEEIARVKLDPGAVARRLQARPTIHRPVRTGAEISRIATAAIPKQRVVSVDALRGFTMFWILGGDGVAWALDEMSAGKSPVVSAVGKFFGTQLSHVDWVGFRFYDLIFPMFIFVTGISIVFSLPRLVEHEGKAGAHLRVLRRFLLLFALGVIYYGGLSHKWPDIRLLGVLQRIAICYLAASLLFLNFRLRGAIVAFFALIVGYWALMTFVPVPGIGVGSFAKDANLANWIDANYLPGSLWDRTRDPEGLLSTLPAIATCLLGVFAGALLINPRLEPRQKALWLFGAGLVMLAGGYLWALQFPLIKAIWTSSFVLVTGGWSALMLGAAYLIVDVCGLRRWATPFVWIGANAITLYMINNLAGFYKIGTRLVGGDLGAFLNHAVSPGTGNFVANVVGLAIAIALAGYLYRRKIFLRV